MVEEPIPGKLLIYELLNDLIDIKGFSGASVITLRR